MRLNIPRDAALSLSHGSSASPPKTPTREHLQNLGTGRFCADCRCSWLRPIDASRLPTRPCHCDDVAGPSHHTSILRRRIILVTLAMALPFSFSPTSYTLDNSSLPRLTSEGTRVFNSISVHITLQSSHGAIIRNIMRHQNKHLFHAPSRNKGARERGREKVLNARHFARLAAPAIAHLSTQPVRG